MCVSNDASCGAAAVSPWGMVARRAAHLRRVLCGAAGLLLHGHGRAVARRVELPARRRLHSTHSVDTHRAQQQRPRQTKPPSLQAQRSTRVQRSTHLVVGCGRLLLRLRLLGVRHGLVPLVRRLRGRLLRLRRGRRLRLLRRRRLLHTHAQRATRTNHKRRRRVRSAPAARCAPPRDAPAPGPCRRAASRTTTRRPAAPPAAAAAAAASPRPAARARPSAPPPTHPPRHHTTTAR